MSHSTLAPALRSRTALAVLVVATACGGDKRARDGDSVASAPPAPAPAAAPTVVPAAPALPEVVVQVGGQEEEVDACSLGAVRAGGASGADGVAVRSGPGARYAILDSLPPRASFHSCTGADGWVGIVYRRETDPPDTTGSCGGLSSPIPQARAYRGPCRSGWIPAAAQETVAG